ncbi:Glutamate racemase [Candidatus Ecksteinia adelgidicola]|nr:Glutamate racemase [Candidatus Ecksteinia adelgidicola]
MSYIDNIHCDDLKMLRPTVLIFDSGFGGLSIYQEVKKLLPYLHYIYAFDNIAFPYGDKPKKFIINRILKIIHKVCQLHAISLLIIACNTVSTIALSMLRKHFNFPIIGTVPAIKVAAHLTVKKIIGVLGTFNTIHCSYTHKLITYFAKNCKIYLLSSSTLVRLAENKLYGKSVPLKILKNILNPLFQMNKNPDVIVLACTHFSLLIEELIKILPKHTQLIDSSIAIAQRAFQVMSTQKDLVLTKENNLAYCIKINKNINILLRILKSYGFLKINQLFVK